MNLSRSTETCPALGVPANDSTVEFVKDPIACNLVTDVGITLPALASEEIFISVESARTPVFGSLIFKLEGRQTMTGVSCATWLMACSVSDESNPVTSGPSQDAC